MPDWSNRIVRHGTADPAQLAANPRNWRIHPQAQQDALRGVLSDVGWVQSVIVNESTGYVVDGHARIALALRTGQATVPVTYVDLTHDEEALILATLDPIAAMAVADAEQLEQLLGEVATEQQALVELLHSTSTPILMEPSRQREPVLQGERVVEIYCSSEDLDDFLPTLQAWRQRDGVSLHIS